MKPSGADDLPRRPLSRRVAAGSATSHGDQRLLGRAKYAPLCCRCTSPALVDPVPPLRPCLSELRDITLFHELLNKRGKAFTLTIGRPVPAAALPADPAAAAAAMKSFVEKDLADDPEADFLEHE